MQNMLVVVRLRSEPDLAPIDKQAADIVGRLAALSGKRPGIAFSSASAETFGVYIRTDKPVGVIRRAVEDQLQRYHTILVFPVDPKTMAGIGDSARWEWLQH